MLASQHHVGSRVLHVSTIRGLSHPRVLSTLIIGTTGIGRLPRERASLPAISRRTFWWGRNRSRHWATLLGAHSYYKHCKTQYEVVKGKCVKPPYRNSTLNWDHPLNQYRPSQGWRLSSSWGKQGGRWVKSDSTTEDNNKAEEQENEWKCGYERQQVEIAQRLERLKKQIDKDPFGMLFGKAIERSINPWTSFDRLLAFRAGKEGTSNGGTSTKSPPPDGDDAKPSTNVARSKETLGKTSTRDQQIGDTATTQSAIDQHVLDFSEPSPSVKTANSPIIVEDYEIDPITLRKVHRIHKEPRPLGAMPKMYTAFDIPVKTFEGGVSRWFLLDRQNDTTVTAEEIPIKPSNEAKPSTSSNIDHKGTPSHTSGKTWLAHEGFGERPAVIAEERATQTFDFAKTETCSPAKASTTRLENSLDRYLRSATDGAKPKNYGKASGKPLVYKAEENKTDDVDLLRASDVRASYGHVAKSGKETDAEKQARRHKIEANYKERRQNLETQYTEELAAEEAHEAIAKTEEPKPELGHGSTPRDLEASFLNEISNQGPSVARTENTGPSGVLAESPETSYQRDMDARVQKEENSYARELEAASTQIPPNTNDFMDNMKAQLVGAGVKYTKELKRGVDCAHDALPRIDNNLSSSARDRKQEAAEKALVEEVIAQKVAMGAVEDRSLFDFSKAASSVQGHHRGEGDMSANVHEFGGRRRWYKNKAPHAVRDEARKLRDRDLICEITGIYEDTYGTIDTKHRQGPRSKSNSKSLIKDWQTRIQILQKEVLESEKENRPFLESAKNREDDVLEGVEKVRSITGEGVVPREEGKDTVPSLTSPQSTYTAPPAPLHGHSSPAPPTLYKVLAHDPLTGQVRIATTTSSVASPEEALLSISEALLRLSSPARFLPHFSALRQAGYEIVSGSGDVLVFKKVRDGGSAADGEDAAVEDSGTAAVASDPIQGATVQTSTPASPSPSTATHYSAVSPPGNTFTPSPTPLPAAAHSPLANPAHFVRRQEAVFSGSRRWRKGRKSDGDGGGGRPKSFKGRARRAARRVLWVGAWTAGCCYAVGVVAEYFRTGGEGGMGPQGF